jgi:hypothetical protein
MDELSQTGVFAEAAAQPDLTQSQPVQQDQPEPMVPVAALQAERRERQQLQENLKLLQDHVALMQANQAKQPAQSQDEFSGLNDHDVLTVGEAKKFISSFQRQQQMAVEELKIAQQHPDYSEVVRKYLPHVLKDDPDLKDVIMSAPNPYKAAYYLAKRSDAYLQEQRNTQRSPEAKQAAANMHRPGNLSSVGQSVPASQSSPWKQMSDADFMKTVNKNMGYS